MSSTYIENITPQIELVFVINAAENKPLKVTFSDWPTLWLWAEFKASNFRPPVIQTNLPLSNKSDKILFLCIIDTVSLPRRGRRLYRGQESQKQHPPAVGGSSLNMQAGRNLVPTRQYTILHCTGDLMGARRLNWVKFPVVKPWKSETR